MSMHVKEIDLAVDGGCSRIRHTVAINEQIGFVVSSWTREWAKDL